MIKVCAALAAAAAVVAVAGVAGVAVAFAVACSASECACCGVLPDDDSNETGRYVA